MIRAHGVEAVRRAEAAAMATVPEGALMQRAAAALAVVVADRVRRCCGGLYGRRVVLLVGPGSNGGDALWAGARLAQRGALVSALLVSGRGHVEGLSALRTAGGRVLDLGEDAGRAAAVVTSADVVVDGVLGIGGRAGLPEGVAAIVRELPDGVPVVAVDLPSGLDPDTGEVAGLVVAADVTVTFGTAKPCLLLPPANGLAGDVLVVDIGLDDAQLGLPVVEHLEPGDAAQRWPVPTSTDDKYSRGVVGVVAGGSTYTGAAVLAAGAAVRAGAGMVRYVGPQAPTDLVRARWPEVVPGTGRVQAWVLGPGVDPRDDEQAAAVRDALGGDQPCVVDAGALEVLAELVRAGNAPSAPLLLTPHAGELARLLGTSRDEVERTPLRHARAAAGLTGATVLLKGATSLVVPPAGTVRAQPDGPHWLATAGSGDVLSGLAGVLLAAGLDPLEAGSVAVLVHGRAGEVASGGGPVGAGTVLDALPAAITELLTGRSAAYSAAGLPD